MNELLAAEVEKDNGAVDLLDRQSYVEKLLKVVKAASDRKQKISFAVNGGWGVGKSFVLDMFEKQATALHQEGEELPKYLILRYDCWEYDYYDEPLIAIVAAMVDELDKKVDLLPASLKTAAISSLKIIGSNLLKSLAQIATLTTGFPVDKLYTIGEECVNLGKKENEEKHAFDEHYEFKKTLKKLRDTIASLSDYQTVIIVIDELDRCMPEYTIKVLERIHHVFEGIDNVQIIFSIDKGQLNHVVHQIFGIDTNAERYLQKFISFEINLDCGSVGDGFDESFGTYFNMFEKQDLITKVEDVRSFKTMIFEGIDMRRRIAIVEKCDLLHQLLCGEEKHDLSWMCAELFLAILRECSVDANWAKQSFSMSDVITRENLHQNPDTHQTIPQGLLKLSEFYKQNRVRGSRHMMILDLRNEDPYVNTKTVEGLILGIYRAILGFEDYWDAYYNDTYRQTSIKDHSKRFWELLQAIS